MKKSELEKELRDVLNKTSQENKSNTPDFILAHYLMDCLDAYNRATNKRNQWFHGI